MAKQTFTKIPGINISGASNGKIFNGYPFAMDYTIGITEPTKLVISFVSEDGTYSPPKPSVKNPFTITVGGSSGGPQVIKDNFYAIKTEVYKSSQGRRLDVTFYDGSIVLDRTWVGLHKKMGDKNQQQPKNLIILGSEQHPCDVNGDRAFTISDIQLIEYDNDQDPCKLRCPGDNAEELMQSNPALISNPVVEECRKKNAYQLLEIRYNFAELLYFINQKGIAINNPMEFKQINRSGAPDDPTGDQNLFKCSNQLTKDFYYPTTPYTGSLREVLTRWCDDLAMLFYWEAGGLSFIDIHTRPKVDLPAIACLSDSTETMTLEGTVSRGAITYYGREGSYFNNPCPDFKRHELSCLTLYDLFTSRYKPITLTKTTDGTAASSSGYTGTPQTKGPLQTGKLSSGNLDNTAANDPNVEYFDRADPNNPPYSEYGDNGGNDGSVYQNGVPVDLLENSCICSLYDERLRWQYILYYYYRLQNQTVAADPQQFLGRRMDRFGGMKILKVAGTAQSNINGNIPAQAGGVYNTLLNNPNIISPAAKKAFVDNYGYFIICELNTKKLNDQYNTERNLAENFLGKHWIKAYYQEYYGAQPECMPVGQYLAAGTVEIKDLEFAHFFHNNQSRVADLATQFKKDRTDPFNDNQAVTDQQTLYHSVLSLLYYTKNPKWTPDVNTSNQFKATLDSYENVLPKIVNNLTLADKIAIIKKAEIIAAQGDDPDPRATPDATDKELNDYYNDIFVITMFPNNEFTFTKTVVEHVEDEDSHYQLVSPYKNGNLGPRLFYGLSGKACVKCVINGITVYTPSGMGCASDYQSNINYGDPTATNGSNPNAPSALKQSNADNAQGLVTLGYGWDYVNNPSYSDSSYETSAPNYAVIVKASYEPFIQIPKVEVVQTTPAEDQETLRVEYITKSINDNNIGPLNAIKAESGQRKQCTLDLDTIKKYHAMLNVAFTNSIYDAYQSNKLTVPGISLPDGIDASIAKGLESISIRIDESSAVQTTYGFGNSLFKPVSIDVATQAIEQRIYDMQSQNVSNNFFNARNRIKGNPGTAMSDPADIPSSSSVTIVSGN